MSGQKNILIAPLNWGLGHAARCIPIIRELIRQGHHVIIASDGVALDFLKKEFPLLDFEDLPAYDIHYALNPFWSKLKLLFQIPKVLQATIEERKITNNLIQKYTIDLIISDNRFGVRNSRIRSIFMTHQLKVLSGWTTWLTTRINLFLIRKFDEIWVPDFGGEKNLSGILGHSQKNKKIRYIGPLSRFQKKKSKIKYDLLVVLSGPEPQRSILEKNMLHQLKHTKLKTILIRGVFEATQQIVKQNNLKIYNFALSKELEELIHASDKIISRSGYTSIMDYCKLEKKVLFIPTPGQNEQEYLAENLEKLKILPFVSQKEFDIKCLEFFTDYKGFASFSSQFENNDFIEMID